MLSRPPSRLDRGDPLAGGMGTPAVPGKFLNDPEPALPAVCGLVRTGERRDGPAACCADPGESPETEWDDWPECELECDVAEDGCPALEAVARLSWEVLLSPGGAVCGGRIPEPDARAAPVPIPPPGGASSSELSGLVTNMPPAGCPRRLPPWGMRLAPPAVAGVRGLVDVETCSWGALDMLRLRCPRCAGGWV